MRETPVTDTGTTSAAAPGCPAWEGGTLARDWPDWSRAIDVDAVLRGQGLDPAQVRARAPRLVEAAGRALILASVLVSPRSALSFAAIACHDEHGVVLEGGGRLAGPLVRRALRGADRVAAVVCTLGARLERAVADQMPGDPMLAMALDGAGNAALRIAVGRVCRDLDRAAAPTGRHAGAPLYPGVGGWRLDEAQRAVCALVDAAAAGVAVSDGGEMRPLKSVSMVVGIGAGTGPAAEACESCDMIGRCRHAAPAPGTERAGNAATGRSECVRR